MNESAADLGAWERLVQWADFTAAGWSRRLVGALALTALPVVFVVVVLALKEARGPFWFGKNSDPDYAYLFNGLAVAQLHSPGHIDHPGTTLQVFAALVLRARHAVVGGDDLVETVLDDPDGCLTDIHRGLLVMGAVILYACGLVTLWATRNLGLALVGQLAPFLSSIVLFIWTGVWVEPVLFTLSLVFGGVTLLWVEQRLPNRPGLFALLFGVLMGAALATKITAIPLVLIPLVLLPWRYKIAFGSYSVVTFFVATLPILPKYRYFLDWIGKLVTHSGAYGEGEGGFIDPNNYLPSLLDMAWNELLLFLVVLLSVAALLVWLAQRWRNPSEVGAAPLVVRGLLALTLTQIVQILLVAKQPDTRHLMPAFGLVGVSLVLLCKVGRALTVRAARCGQLLVVMMLLQAWWTGIWHAALREDSRTQLALLAWLDANYADCQLIPYYSATSPLYALWFGNWTTRSWEGEHNGRYSAQLQARYPQALFYDRADASFCNFLNNVDLETVQAATAGRRVVLIGWAFVDDDAKYQPADVTLEPLFPDELSPQQEAAYRLRIP